MSFFSDVWQRRHPQTLVTVETRNAASHLLKNVLPGNKKLKGGHWLTVMLCNCWNISSTHHHYLRRDSADAECQARCFQGGILSCMSFSLAESLFASAGRQQYCTFHLKDALNFYSEMHMVLMLKKLSETQSFIHHF